MSVASAHQQSLQHTKSSLLSAAPPSSPASIDMDEAVAQIPLAAMPTSRDLTSLSSKNDSVDDDFKDFMRNESSTTIVNAIQSSPLPNKAGQPSSASIPNKNGKPSSSISSSNQGSNGPKDVKEPKDKTVDGAKKVEEEGTARVAVGGRTKLVKRKSHQAHLLLDTEDKEAEELVDNKKVDRANKSEAGVDRVEGEVKEAKLESMEPPSSGSTKEQEEEEVEEDDDPFDPSAPVEQFDYKTEFVVKWDMIQKDMTPVLKRWAEQTLENCFASIYSTVHLFHLLNDEGAKNLTDGVAEIKAEEAAQRASQESIHAFAAHMQTVTASLSGFGGQAAFEHAGQTVPGYSQPRGRQAAFVQPAAGPPVMPTINQGVNRPGHRPIHQAPIGSPGELRGYASAPAPQGMHHNGGHRQDLHAHRGHQLGYGPPPMYASQSQQSGKRLRTGAADPQ